MNSETNYNALHYGERANDYVTSKVHSSGPDLDAIENQVKNKSFKKVLDLGCGGGHVTYKIAPYVEEVIACDITGEMLDCVKSEAINRKLDNIKTVQSIAENLPFKDAEFDAVFCRFTTHHWNDVTAGLREMKRVSKPNGFAMFIDIYSPESALLDSWLQTIELLRDISHVRDLTITEWTSSLGDAGFYIKEMKTSRLRMEFNSWIARTKTPSERVEVIKSLLKAAPKEVSKYFTLEENLSFHIDSVCFIAHS